MDISSGTLIFTWRNRSEISGMASLVPVVRFEIESNDDAKIYVTVS
jgi:hypothetical protein